MGRERRKWTAGEDSLLREAVTKGWYTPVDTIRLIFLLLTTSKHAMFLTSKAS